MHTLQKRVGAGPGAAAAAPGSGAAAVGGEREGERRLLLYLSRMSGMLHLFTCRICLACAAGEQRKIQLQSGGYSCLT
jgi:hypothetical protein